MRLRRETVTKFWCPVCKSGPGQPCTLEGTGEIREQLHRARVEKAERMIGATLSKGETPTPTLPGVSSGRDGRDGGRGSETPRRRARPPASPTASTGHAVSS